MLWLLIGIVALSFVLLHLPSVQGVIGEKTAAALSEKLNTHVEIGSVNIGMLNRIIIDDVMIEDQDKQEMLSASRLSAKIDLASLFSGKISITSAQFFGTKLNLYKKEATTPPNYQFIIDALSSQDSTQEEPLDLAINSLIIRNGELSYDQQYIPRKDKRFTPHHIKLTNISGHLVLNHLTNKDVDLKIKRLSFKENSGLHLQQISFDLQADSTSALLTNLTIKLPQSTLMADSLNAHYRMEDGELIANSIQYKGNIGLLNLNPADIAFVVPQLKTFGEPLVASSRFSGTSNSLNLHSLNVKYGSLLSLDTNGTLYKKNHATQYLLTIGNLAVDTPKLQELFKSAGFKMTIPPPIVNLGRLSYSGDVAGSENNHALMGNLSSEAGKLKLNIGINNKHVKGHVDTDNLQLNKILDTDQLGLLATSIDIEGDLPISKDMSVLAKGLISKLEYKGHTYNNMVLDGQYDNEQFEGLFNINDPNGELSLSGIVNLSAQSPKAVINATARHFNPQALGIVNDELKGHVFDFDLKADLSGHDINDLKGVIDLENLHWLSQDKNYQLASLHLDADNEGVEKHIDLDGDFGSIHLSGNYEMDELVGCVSNIIKSKLPTLPYLKSGISNKNGSFSFSADIDRSDWIKQFADLPITINAPMHLQGDVDEKTNSINLECYAPSVEYDEGDYRDLEIIMKTENDTLYTDASVIIMQSEGKRLDIALSTKAMDNNLMADLAFNNNGNKQLLKGTLSSRTTFGLDANNTPQVHVMVNPSQIFVKNTPWDVVPSELVLSKNSIVINGEKGFSIQNKDQKVEIHGSLTNNPNDTIKVSLNQLDAEFLSNILHVNGVDFGGKISGNATVTSVYDTPEAKATLFVDDFTFENGLMGDMTLDANWNAQDNNINISAIAKDGTEGTTIINGHVGLESEDINLDITAQKTPLHFLERFCNSFMPNIDARIDGHVRVFGPLSTVNLEGKVVGNGPLYVSSLNTIYNMQNDTVNVVPDHIIFVNDTIVDKYGHRGILTGSVDHHNLSGFTFDLGVKAQNMLCYDFKQFGGDTFCGTVFATGNCNIHGVSGEITIDVDATPEKNTLFYYNAASPEALSNQDFIVWNDVTPEQINFDDLPSASDSKKQTLVEYDEDDDEEEEVDIPTNLKMNFHINATPQAELRLLMDENGDYISLFGQGALRASYFNKGAFKMNGNYIVDHGLYKLTIQNVIKKDFQFRPGGTITFGGDPYNANLDLVASYTINGVPLSDLNIGGGFSNNNIPVNCLMNIKGTPYQPTVDFDLELPKLNSEAEQMVRRVINGEEELNQQVIYLLAIGRFYNSQTDSRVSETGQSRTSLAMQSLLSGTISQQISSVLSNFVKSNNWNFGANISTGDEGFNNAEYEGLLSGRLFDNRLIINGEFGYRDNPNATTSFIGDFDIQYLLYPNGNLAVKVYNQTNDRYFIKNSLNTQGLGLMMKKDFNGWQELIGIQRKKKKNKKP